MNATSSIPIGNDSATLHDSGVQSDTFEGQGTTGQVFGSDYVVESGLAVGDRVVIEGLQKIRDGMTVKPTTAKSAETPASPTAATGS